MTVRVLVADDSAAVRAALRATLAGAGGIEIVGAAADGLEAVRLAVALRPDVITMDVRMPGLDGLAAIDVIMREAPSRILVVSAATDDAETDLSFRAMVAGALEVIAKPSAGADAGAWADRLARTIRLMAEVPVVGRRRGAGGAWAGATPARGSIDVVGVVASTGGPPVLAGLLGALPATLPIPMLVAQHLASGFTAGLVRWLQGTCALVVETARAGMVAAPGHVYLPPDDHDLAVDAEGLLMVSPARDLHRPSGDRLLASLAAAWRSRAAGLVLTGMGQDGARGLLAIRRAGGLALAQDEASSVVFGMPRAARDLGAAEALVRVEAMATAVLARARPGGARR